jgi:galactonate dehydratase
MNAANIRAISLHHVHVTPKTTWSFLELKLDDGTTGWGEATLMHTPRMLDAPAAAAKQALTGHTLTLLDDYVAARGIAPLPQASIASALEQAAWDARAQQAGCSAAQLRGTPARQRVTLYANMNRRTTDRSPAGFFTSAQQSVAAGYAALKMAPFDQVNPENDATPEGRRFIDEGLARVAAVRQAAGPDVQVYVDCHWRFKPMTASAVLRELAALGVTWFECPLPEIPEAMVALRKLRAESNARGMRLAGLEELTHPDAFLPWLQAGCYDVVMPDVKYAGGISGVLRVAELAAAHTTACAPHNPSGPVCHAASLAVCAIGSHVEMLEHQFDETPAFWDLVDGDLPRPQKGVSDLPTGLGLGVAIRRALLPPST